MHVRGNVMDNCREMAPFRGMSAAAIEERSTGRASVGRYLEAKTMQGVSTRIRFDNAKMSGRHEQAEIREKRNTGWAYPVASIEDE